MFVTMQVATNINQHTLNIQTRTRQSTRASIISFPASFLKRTRRSISAISQDLASPFFNMRRAFFKDAYTTLVIYAHIDCRVDCMLIVG